MLVYGELSLVGNVNLNSSIQSMAELNINGNTLNANNAVIMSKYNDINISSENVSVTGLIYAPLGEVNINAGNCNLNNVIIIASKINIQCGNLNVNYNSNIGKNICITSELVDIDRGDWKYILDTDGDGLNDYYETYFCITDITLIDTNSDGISDFDDDADDDLLTNGEELKYETHPLDDDSDNDNLLDGDEVYIYGSKPIVTDVDGDGLIDGDEVYLNTSIFIMDTDGDGITDDKEMYEQSFIFEEKKSVIEEVSVIMECTGNINRTTSVENMCEVDAVSSSVAGLIGSPYEINTESYFEQAKISFKLNDEYLEKNSIEELLILWYDEANNEFVAMDTEYDDVSGVLSTVTTHFSQYMIVDSNEWFEAWMKEIDYYSNGEDKSLINNTVIVLDCSGSMDTYDRISVVDGKKSCYRIEAAENYISVRGFKDNICIISFANTAKVLMSMSSNKYQLKEALQNISDYGGTNFNVAIKSAIEQFSDEQLYADETNNRIIFISDGIASCSGSYLAEAKSKGIAIHTVGLGNSSGDIVLKNMAETTNGTFMKAVTANELIDIFTEFGLGEMDTTDTDADGLYDVIEVSGIRLENGTIIYTDPTEADSDSDGLLDGEEIVPTPLSVPVNIVQLIKSKYNGSDYSELGEYYFRMLSNPNNKDTDGDGYNDGDEVNIFHTNPKRSDVKNIKLNNDFVSVKYEGDESWEYVENNIKTSYSYGGSQMWFFYPEYDDDLGMGKKIEKNGCGLISIADIILYLSMSDDKYKTSDTRLAKMVSGHYSYESYLEYVYEMETHFPPQYVVGILGTNLASYANEYFLWNDYGLSAKWCIDKELLLTRIEGMLKDNIPVTFSVGPSLNGDYVKMYIKNGDEYIEVYEINGHYMTATGLQMDDISGQIWIELSSWGKKYYINFNEYMSYINNGLGRNVTSNILLIEE